MTRRAPLARHVTPAATDDSPVYANHGRSAKLSTALLGDIEAEEERRSTLYAQLNPKENKACAALRNGDLETAARLYDELARAWLDGGFVRDAASCAALAASARNPKPVAPKTIGRRGR